MFQLSVPRKVTTRIQVFGSCILVLIALIMSFTPLINLQVLDEDTANSVNELLELVNKELDDPIPLIDADEMASYGISLPKLVGSAQVISHIVDLYQEDTSSEVEKTQAEKDAMRADLIATLSSEKGRETFKVLAALVATVIRVVEGDDEDAVSSTVESLEVDDDTIVPAGINSTVEMVFSILSLFYVLFFIVIFPFVMLITALVMLITTLKNLNAPENAVTKVGRQLPNMVGSLLFFFILQRMVPGMSFGSGAVAVFVLCLAGALLNFLASRTRSYDAADFRYINLLQGTALGGMIGFLVFFFNILKVDLVIPFFDGWSTYSKLVEFYQKLAGDKMDLNFAYLVDLGLVIAFMCVVLFCYPNFQNYIQRFTCTVAQKRNEFKFHDSSLPGSIVLLLLAYVAPKYLAASKHAYEYTSIGSRIGIDADSALHIFKLDAADEKALQAALVGLIIMLLADVAMIVGKKILCAGYAESDAVAVMTGRAKTSEEKEAEEAELLRRAEEARLAKEESERIAAERAAEAAAAAVAAAAAAAVAAQPVAQPAAPAVNIPEELKKYKALLDEGVITEEDYNAKKAKLLNL